MPNNWGNVPFAEAVEVNPTVPINRGITYPFVDMQTVQPWQRDVEAAGFRVFTGGGSQFRSGDTLMARITPSLENGKTARFRSSPEQPYGHGSTEFIVIRGKQGVTDNDFAYYLTQSGDVRSYAISQMTGSSGRQRVPVESLKYLQVQLPPLAEQRAIAHILGTLDDKIKLNRRMNETLEGSARAIFKSWFVDFDPVQAKAEGRDSGLPREIADLFPDRFEDSVIGEVPVGWEVRPLPEIIDINPPRTLRKGIKVPYLDMANMPKASARALEVSERLVGSGARFINGDTLVARITPSLEHGKTCFVDFLGEGIVGWGSTEYIVLRPKPPLPNEYAYFLARTKGFRNFAISNMTGTTGRQRVPADSLAQYYTVFPDHTITKLFGKVAHGIMTSMKAHDDESHTLASLRDTLLPKLISGQLHIPDANRFLKEGQG